MHPDRIPSLATLEARARLFDAVRAFLRGRGYLEVDTPALRPYASMEPHLISFETSWQGPGGRNATLYLHTSPEYSMKQVIAAHQRSIFQLAKVYRGEEHSDSHVREFVMLEWYRVGEHYRFLMQETEELVQEAARCCGAWPTIATPVGELRLDQPFERLTVRQAFLRYAQFDPFELSDPRELAHSAREAGCQVGLDWSWEDTFHLALLELVEPNLGVARPTFLIDYPARLAALACTREESDHTVVAERFELYAGGLELCNGFTELTDQAEQRRRFEEEQALRASLGRTELELDEGLLDALAHLPRCTGNALGLDRLLMLLLGLDSVHDSCVTSGP